MEGKADGKERKRKGKEEKGNEERKEKRLVSSSQFLETVYSPACIECCSHTYAKDNFGLCRTTYEKKTTDFHPSYVTQIQCKYRALVS